MLDINSPVQWQKRDIEFPTYYPWYTSGMLDVIDSWKTELISKDVMEWGGGWSSIFWAFYCRTVLTIETDEKWANDIREYAAWIVLNNLEVIHRPVNEGDQSKVEYFTEIPRRFVPDIVCIDSVLRHECLLKSLTIPRPLTIIHDNWMQDGFICPASEELMKPFDGHIYRQEDHTDHHGNPWQTAYFEIPAKC
jgi:hypothetical protein